jgi:sRNA-binding protein
MIPNLIWTAVALAMLACGWYASAWYHKRKIAALRDQIKAVRQLAAEHANQARRQIGQLQADLAARQAAAQAQREAQPAPAPAPPEPAAPPAKNSDNDFDGLLGLGGFASTQVMPRSHGGTR